MIFAIDFDGVIVEDQYPAIGQLMPDAKNSMRLLFELGHILIINTCRAGKFAAAAQEYLKEQDIPFHYFNENMPERIEKYGEDCRKISADVYIDDKNFGGFLGWIEVLTGICYL